jgi:hypothetical protein
MPHFYDSLLLSGTAAARLAPLAGAIPSGPPSPFGSETQVPGLSARTLVSQHRVPKSGLWKGFSGVPTAAFAAVGYLDVLLPPHHVDVLHIGDDRVVGEVGFLQPLEDL